MKRPALAEDLVPVNELRARLADWLKHVKQTGRPVVVTSRGRAQAVLVQPEVFDEIEETRELVTAVLRGLRELDEGHLIDDEEVWAEVDEVLLAADGP